VRRTHTYTTTARRLGRLRQAWRCGANQESVLIPVHCYVGCFEVDAVSLVSQPFEQLLPTLSDPVRYQSAQKRIAKHLRRLKAVG
jgi:hypothetical protein